MISKFLFSRKNYCIFNLSRSFTYASPPPLFLLFERMLILEYMENKEIYYSSIPESDLPDILKSIIKLDKSLFKGTHVMVLPYEEYEEKPQLKKVIEAEFLVQVEEDESQYKVGLYLPGWDRLIFHSFGRFIRQLVERTTPVDSIFSFNRSLDSFLQDVVGRYPNKVDTVYISTLWFTESGKRKCECLLGDYLKEPFCNFLLNAFLDLPIIEEDQTEYSESFVDYAPVTILPEALAEFYFSILDERIIKECKENGVEYMRHSSYLFLFFKEGEKALTSTFLLDFLLELLDKFNLFGVTKKIVNNGELCRFAVKEEFTNNNSMVSKTSVGIQNGRVILKMKD